MLKTNLILSVILIATMSFSKFPHAEISNSLIKATVLLPDEDKGYYRGQRFDWSANMPVLQFGGHNYFGQWFSKYSPEIHDVIMGPVEEFTGIDFAEAKAGESFVKIGVGVLYKPDTAAYDFRRTYPVLNGGKWSVKKKSDQVTFIHDLKDKQCSYHYEKTVLLPKDKPELIISHALNNTGTRTIETTVYDHNFFTIDMHPIGPGYVVKFPFKLSGEGTGLGVLGELNGNQIDFIRAIGNGEEIFCPSLKGFGTTADDYVITIENRITGAGVKISCDQPFQKLAFWCCPTTLCPEPYIKVKAEPGKTAEWTIRYQFYTMNKK